MINLDCHLLQRNVITNISQRPKIFFARNIAIWKGFTVITCLSTCIVAHWSFIGDICKNLKGLIFSFLKLLRGIVNFQMLHIGENNFKSLQLRTFYCFWFKKLLDEILLKFTAFCYCEESLLKAEFELICFFSPGIWCKSPNTPGIDRETKLL